VVRKLNQLDRLSKRPAIRDGHVEARDQGRKFQNRSYEPVAT